MNEIVQNENTDHLKEMYLYNDIVNWGGTKLFPAHMGTMGFNPGPYTVE